MLTRNPFPEVATPLRHAHSLPHSPRLAPPEKWCGGATCNPAVQRSQAVLDPGAAGSRNAALFGLTSGAALVTVVHRREAGQALLISGKKESRARELERA